MWHCFASNNLRTCPSKRRLSLRKPACNFEYCTDRYPEGICTKQSADGRVSCLYQPALEREKALKYKAKTGIFVSSNARWISSGFNAYRSFQTKRCGWRNYQISQSDPVAEIAMTILKWRHNDTQVQRLLIQTRMKLWTKEKRKKDAVARGTCNSTTTPIKKSCSSFKRTVIVPKATPRHN